MARRRHLIAYDIADPVRLRRIAKVMEGYGDRLQFSVFLCDLSATDAARWEAEVRDIMDLGVDSVVVIDLGTPRDDTVRCIGAARRLPRRGPVIA